jgi:gliding motility-associated-like protein
MAATPAGGYVLTGQAESTDGDLSCNAGIDDVWLLQIDGTGNLQWSKTMGGSNFDIGYAVQQLGDGSFVVAAETCSPEVPGYHYSATNSTCGDYWVIKLSAPGVAPTPSVTITPASGMVCANSAATFTAGIQNGGGVTQSYSWTRNGVAVGGNSSMYTASNFNEGDVLMVTVQTGAGVCDVGGSWITASQTVHINPNILHPAVQISSSSTFLCNCAPAQFTVTVTGGGTEPAYQWMIDGVIQGTNSESFLSASLLPTDVVECQYFDSSGCVANAPVVSNSISLTPGTGASVSVSISGPLDSVCAGSPDTIAASAVNAGANPTYQWQVNGGDVGSNSSTYTSSGLANGDVVTCIVTPDPSFTCSSGAPANSNPITVALAAKSNPSVVMTVSSDTLCTGDTAVFKATVQQAGADPTYVWSVDGVANGATGPVFSGQNFSNGDVVQCVVTVDPNYTCSLTNTASSAPITLDVLNQPDPTIVIAGSPNAVCSGGQIEFNATGQNAGVSPSYQWMVNGQPVGGNAPTFGSNMLNNGDVVTCRMMPGVGACLPGGIVSGPVVADVEPLPVVEIFPADTVLLSGGQVTLQGEVAGNVATFQWAPANLLTDPGSLTPETVPLQDSVQFTLTVQDAQGCVGTAAAKVLIYRALAMPNAFTPNGDGMNDVFRIPPGMTMQLTEMDIYDRWGMRVFSTRNISQGWDGTVGGRPAPAGTYVYMITGSGLKGPVSAKGTVMLVR